MTRKPSRLTASRRRAHVETPENAVASGSGLNKLFSREAQAARLRRWRDNFRRFWHLAAGHWPLSSWTRTTGHRSLATAGCRFAAFEPLEPRHLLATWTQQDHLFAFPDPVDPQDVDRHGEAVAVDGDWMVVGAPCEDVNGLTDAGAAFVYRRDDAGTAADTSDDLWLQTARLTASDAAAGDLFGFSVGISGDTVVVGSRFDDDAGTDSGSAYVFTRSGGAWSQQDKLTASDAAAGDAFGWSVGISGDSVVVGSVADDDAGSNSGSAYVFTRSGGAWSQQDKLTASDAAAGDAFGISVGISGESVVVGSFADDDAGSYSGSAYVFTRSGGAWSQQDKLTASDAAAGDLFGSSVGISGESVVVGSRGDDDGGSDSGSAYVFTRSGGAWSQQDKLTASDAAAGDLFGRSVGISGESVVVGSRRDDDAGSDSGSAYVFTRSGGVWSQQDKLTASDAAAGDNFGFSVGISGESVVVGSPFDDVANDGVIRSDAGSAYVFNRDGTTWTQQDHLFAFPDPIDPAGVITSSSNTVSVDGDWMVAGANNEDVNGFTLAGAAYVYRRDDAGTPADTSDDLWLPSAKLTASDAATGDRFGVSVAISGDTIAVGSFYDDGPAGAFQGSAYVFTRSGNSWTEQQKLTASDAAAQDVFGRSVGISGDTVVVGAYNDRDAGPFTGSAYVFTRSGGVWTEQQKLTASDAATLDAFGASVAISGDSIVVGSHGDSSYAGGAYVFTRSGGTWTEQDKLVAADPAAQDRFGRSVSISGDSVVVGSPYDDDAGNASGSAYVFTRSGGSWSQQQKVVPSDATANDRFGLSVSISADSIVVGGFQDTAYVFARSGPTWTEQQKLTADDGSALFGRSVTINDNKIVSVGAGSAYVFDGTGGTWTQQDHIFAFPDPVDAQTSDRHGEAVAVDGDWMVVGAPFEHVNGLANAGAAYVYRRDDARTPADPSDDLWLQIARLTASDAAASDRFGDSVGISGESVVVGSYRDDDAGSDSGSAYVFTRSGGSWSQQDKLTASDAAAGDGFGFSVGISDDSVVVGSTGDDDGGTNSGSAYVFTRSGGAWSQQDKLTASDAAAGDNFGFSVGISGESVVVGSRLDDDAGGSSGSAYVFTRSGGSWSQQDKLTASDAAAGDNFGFSVGISGESVVVGSPVDDDAGGSSGSAYVFTRSGTSWSQQDKLTAADAAAGDLFGLSVGISGESVVVGSRLDDDAGGSSGSAYVFTRSGGSWSQQDKLTASDAAAGDNFGLSVGISGESVVVGSPVDDVAVDGTIRSDAGSAYVFARVSTSTTDIFIDGNDDLIVRDIGGDDTDDTLTVVVSGSNYRITDPNNELVAGNGATQVDPNTVDVPIASVTGTTGMLFDTLGGDDSLTIDFGGGNFTRAITFNGGTQNTSPGGDTLTLQGGGTFALAEYNFDNANDGTIDITGNQTITYTGLEPITSSIDATNVTLNYSTAAEMITVTDAGGGQTTVNSTAGETTTFNNPTGTLTINAGDTGDDIINVDSLAASYPANVTIDGQGGNDTVSINTTSSMGSLTVVAETIDLTTTVTTTGAQTYNGAVVLAEDRTTNGASVTIGGSLASQVTPYSQTILADSPVAYWQFEETSGVTAADATGNGHTGTASNGPDFNVAGQVDSGIQYDGVNDVILVGDDPALRPTQITLEAWVNPATGIGIWDNVFHKTSTGGWTDGYGMEYDGSGSLRFWVNHWDMNVVTVPVSTGQWQHIVGTYDGSELRIYKNGVLEDSENVSLTINHSTAALRLGQGQGANTYTWTGELDELAIYDTALSDTQVAAHYNAGLSGGSGVPALTINGNAFFGDNSTWNVAIAGTSATLHDRIIANGTVNIGTSVTLNPSALAGYTPTSSDVFTIIDNDGSDAVVGTFAGLAEGGTLANFLGSGIDFNITYAGGDGNDVVVKVIEAPIVVTTAVDENDGTPDPGTGAGTSLREAVIAANAAASQSTITFDPSLDGNAILLSIVGTDEDAAADGDLDVTSEIIIQGNGADQTQIDGGTANERIFNVLSGGNLSLTGVRVSGGNAGSGSGGGLRVVSGASASLVESWISDNQARSGGGIITSSGANLTILNSTISNNSATGSPSSFGGGVRNEGTMTLTNSTVSNNSAGSAGGGILDKGTLTVTNSTFSGNTIGSSSGRGINASQASTTINNTIFVNHGGDDIALSGDAAGGISGSNNLADQTTGVPGRIGAVTNFDATLQNNGGPTPTHALLAGSNAIDVGNNSLAVDAGGAPLTSDQRSAGFDRIVNGTVDIGSFEFGAGPVTYTLTASIDGANNLVIDESGGDTNDGLTISFDGTDFTIAAAGGATLGDGGISGASGDGTGTLTIPLASFSGGIVINTLGGDDSLTVDFDGGANFSRSITFNGGTQNSTSPGDQISLTGGGTFALAEYNFDNANDGTIDITGNATITYTGLEPINAGAITATDVTLNYSTAAETITASEIAASPGGALDTTFDTDGLVLTQAAAPGSAFPFSTVKATAIDSMGRVVVAGIATNAHMLDLSFVLARYNPDGTLDTTFGTDGIVFTNPGVSQNSAANSLVIDAAGKIVVAGSASNLNGPTVFALARFNSDGSLDTTFDSDGSVLTDANDASASFKISEVRAIAIDAVGRIVAAGYARDATNTVVFALARYNPDGSLDTTFDTDGLVRTQASDPAGSFQQAIAESVTIDGSGRILVAGNAVNASGGSNFALARYSANGSLDTSFDTDGVVLTAATGGAASIAIDAAGKIVVGGRASTGFAIGRYNIDGSLDTSFDSDGLVITDASDPAAATKSSSVSSIVVDDFGRIVAAGKANDAAGNESFALARYNADGSLDTTFDSDGLVLTDANATAASSKSSFANSIAIDATGNIVTAGQANDTSNKPAFALARYEGGQPSQTRIASTAGETVTIANPTGMLTINAGDTGDDIINIDSLAASYPASLTINGGTGTDNINVNGTLSFAAGKDVSLTADDVLVNDVLTGLADVNVTVDNDVDIAAGGQINADTLNLSSSSSWDLGTNSAGNASITPTGLGRIDATTITVTSSSDIFFSDSMDFTVSNTTQLDLTSTGGTIGDTNTGGTDVTVATLKLDGNVSPGQSPGILNVDGAVAIDASSTTTIELDGNAGAGLNPNGHDQIAATAAVALGGTLTVDVSDFDGVEVLANSGTYTIVTGASVTGTFSNYNDGDTVATNLGGNSLYSLEINYLPTSVTLTVAVGNNAPVISNLAGDTLGYTENDAATVIDQGTAATASDADGNWTNGTLEVQITASAEAADEISIQDVGNITVNTANGQISSGGTVFGTASTNDATVTNNATLTVTFNALANNTRVSELLQAVSYRSTSDDPGTSDRTVQFTLADALAASSSANTTVQVTAVNDAPVRTAPASLTPIDVNEDSANTTAVSLGLGGATYSAVEAGQTLTYTITAIPSPVTLFKVDGTTPVNVNDTVTAGELQGLKYKTVADANGSGNLTFTVVDNGGTADGGQDTLTENLSITVNAVNDPPTVTTNTGLTVSEGSKANLIGQAQLETTDVEQSAAQLTYTLDSVPAAGTLYIDGNSNNMPDGAAEILVATETFTQDDVDSNRLKYNHDGSDTTSASFQFDVSDGAASVDDQTFDITVTPADTEVTLASGVLTITDVNNGGDSDDTLLMSYSGGTYTIRDFGGLILDASSIANSAGNGTDTVTVPDTGVTGVKFDTLGGDDLVTVNSVQSGFSGDFTIAGGSGTDRANVAADIATTGTGKVDITVSQRIFLGSGSSITTVDGGITLSANPTGLTAGDFEGLWSFGATIQTTGTGDISLSGRGGNNGNSNNNQRGVRLSDGASVSSTAMGADAGTITINGTGGSGTSNNYGVWLDDTTTDVTSVDGNIEITGTGGAGSSFGNTGVVLSAIETIRSTGTGASAATITITGTAGGVGGSSAGLGIDMFSATTDITSVNGDIVIVGTGTTAAGGGVGVSIGSIDRISSTGTGATAATITVTGTGGAGAGSSDNAGVHLNSGGKIVSDAGAVTITGTGGSGASNDNHGVHLSGDASIQVTSGQLTVTGTAVGGNTDGVRLDASTGGQLLSAGSGGIAITGTGNGPGSDVSAGADSIIGGAGAAGPITINADSIDLSGTLSVQSSGDLTIQPRTAGTPVNLGGGSGGLDLDDTELGFLQDGFSSITIGDTTNGTGTVDIDTATFADPVTIAGGTINDNAGTDITNTDATSPNVTLDGNVAPGQSPGILTVSGDFAFADNDTFTVEIGGTSPGTANNNHDQLQVTGGDVTIGTGVTLDDVQFNSFVPTIGQTFTIIDVVTAGKSVSGTFDGLPEGGTVLNFLGSSLDASISYVGGDGNDVVLTAIAPIPCTVSWASAVSGNWNDGTKWDTGVAPTAGDRVCITATGAAYTVTLNVNIPGGSALSRFTLDSANAAFSASGRTFAVDGVSDVIDGTVVWDGSTWTGDAASALTNDATIIVGGFSTISTNSLEQEGSVDIQANGSTSARLIVTNGFTNVGSIELRNISGIGSGDATLQVNSGILTNEGTITAGPGGASGGGGSERFINANVTNAAGGTVNINRLTFYNRANTEFINLGDFNTAAGGQAFQLNNSNQTFTQADGTLNNLGGFTADEDTFNFDGGTLSGAAPVLSNSTLNIGAGSTGAGEFAMRGLNGVLNGDVAAAQTVRIQADGGNSARVTAANGFTNDGTIVLENIQGIGAGDATLQVSTGILTNEGTITAAPGGAGGSDSIRYINGNVTNAAGGTVNINRLTYFSRANTEFINHGDFNTAAGGQAFQLNNSNQTFTQADGTLNNLGGFTADEDTFNFDGGTLSGAAPVLSNSTLNIGAGSTGPGEFAMRGLNGVLNGDVAAAQTVRIQADGGNSARVTAANGFTNNGTIILENISIIGAGDATLRVTSGTLVNEGVITTAPGGAGSDSERFFRGNVTNNGTVNINRATYLNPADTVLTNNANFNVSAGNSFTLNSTNQTFTQAGGTLDLAGLLAMDDDAFNFTGGSITGGGAAVLTSSNVLAAGAAAINVNVAGADVELGGVVDAAGVLDIGEDTSAGTGGDYTQSSTTDLFIDLGGDDPGTGFDQLNVEGVADLSGRINVSLIGGFTPDPCQVFEVVTFGARIGITPTFTGLNLGGGLFLRPVFTPTSLLLVTYDSGSVINVHPTSVSISEDGTNDTYDICLAVATPPTDIVTVNVSPDSELTTSVPSVSFNPAGNWDQPQTVTVMAVDDFDVEGNHTGTITHSATSNDGAFDGAAVASVTANITDNDIANVFIDNNDDLVILDVEGNGDDTLTISVIDDAGVKKVRVHDSNNVLGAGSGVVQVDGSTVTAVLSTITGGDIKVDTLGGNDTLTVDFGGSGGNFVAPLTGIRFDGGETSESGGDELVLTGGGMFDGAMYHFNNVSGGAADNGTIDITGNPTITYTGLEPIDAGGITATDVTLNYSAAAETVTVTDVGSGNTKVASTAGESVTFANPSGMLTIHAGDTGVNTININSLAPNLPANIDIDGGNGAGSVNINGAVDLANGNLSASADTITLLAPITTGGGAVNLTADNGVLLSGANADVSTGGGSFTVDADADNDGEGSYSQDNTGSVVDTTGTTDGNVSITAADVDLQGTISAGGGLVTFRPSQSGAEVHLGEEVPFATHMLWKDDPGVIKRAHIDGSNVQDVVFNATGVTIDHTAGKIYWVDSVSGNTFKRGNPDGSNVETVFSVSDFGLGEPYVDGAAGKIYWSRVNPVRQNTRDLRRANLDGTNIETVLLQHTSLATYVADASLDAIYTSRQGSRSDRGIYLADINGSSNTKLLNLTYVAEPRQMALDVVGGKLYWTDSGYDTIYRANLNGSNPQAIITDLSTNQGLALDVNANKLYWTDRGGDRIQRSNLNGSSIQTLVSTGEPRSLVLTFDHHFTLTDAELDNVTTTNQIVVGDATTGDVTLNAPINLTGNSPQLEINSNGATSTIGDTNTTGTDATVTDLVLSGNVGPGTSSPGILGVSGSVSLADNSTFTVQVGGTSPGTGNNNHDQLDVNNGVVTIGSNVTLNTAPFNGFNPSELNTFTIIDNDGTDAVVGTFAGLAEGATIANFLGSGLTFAITYAGGAGGNDVVLSIADSTPPTVSIARDDANPTNANAVTFSVDFSEDVQNVSAADFDLALGGSVAANAAVSVGDAGDADAATYTVTVDTIDGDGTLGLDIDAVNVDIKDASGNPLNTTPTIDEEYTVDNTPPTPVITGPASPTNSDPFNVTIDFGETVNNFVQGNVTVVGGSVSSFSDNNDGTFTVGIDAATDGAVSVSVVANVITDDAGNNNAASNTFNVTVDATAPTPSITGPASPTGSDSFSVTIDFGETVNDFVQSDVTVTGGSVSSFTDNNDGTFTVGIDAAGDGVVSVSVAANVATDGVGNSNIVSNSFNVAVDTTAPTPVLAGPSSPTTNDPFNVSIGFGEPVSGFVAGDIVVGNGLVTNLVDHGNGNFTATVDAVSDGQVTVSVPAGVAQDLAGNPNDAATQWDVTVITSISAELIIDNGDAGFSAPKFSGLGAGYVGAVQGYQGDIHYHAPATGGLAAATWTFENLSPGTYQVATTWNEHSNRANDSPFTITGVSNVGTVHVNQRLAPNTFSGAFFDDGVYWAPLDLAGNGGNFAVSGTTLTVTLGTSVHGYVIADAVRIAQIAADEPELEVLDGDGAVINGGIALPTVQAGTVVAETITILNLGSAPLGLGAITINGDTQLTLDTTGTNSALPAGQSTTFDVLLDTSSAGTFNATVSIPNNDGDENPFEFTVAGTVDPPSTSPIRIIDNGDAGFSAPKFSGLGVGYVGKAQGYEGDIHYHAPSTPGAAAATWTFDNLAPGTYQVAVTWNGHSNRANNSPFTVTGTTTNGTVPINQRLAPSTFADSFSDDGVFWAPLDLAGNGGNFTVSGATLTVTLGTSPHGYVIADAVRIEKMVSLEPEIEVLDSGNNSLTSGSSEIVLPNAQVGATVSEAVTIKNLGSAQLDLGSISIAGDMQFTLDTSGTDLTLTAGQSTTFDVLLDTSADGTFNATVSIPSLAPNDDADENPFVFTVQGTVEAPQPVEDVTIIDNGEEGFSSSGGFSGLGAGYFGALQGYQDDIHYRGPTAPGVGAATWTFNNLDPGTYQVAVTWNAHSNRAEDAPFTLAGTTTNGTVHIDQTQAPGTFAGAISDDGVDWAPLNVGGNGGNFTLSGATLTVTLGTTPQGYVIADAVRIEKLPELRLDEAEVRRPESVVSGQRAVTNGQRPVASRGLSQSDVDAAFNSAVAQWSAVDASASARLSNVTVQIANLPGNVLGLASAPTERIWLDADAAGHGWAVSPATRVKGQEPDDVSLFTPSPSHLLPSSSFDLLIVVTHELGHVLGLPDLDAALHPHEVMAGRLDAGLRRLPIATEMTATDSAVPQGMSFHADRLFADLGESLADRLDQVSAFNSRLGGQRLPGWGRNGTSNDSLLLAGRVLDDEDPLMADLADRQADRRDEEWADELFTQLLDETSLVGED